MGIVPPIGICLVCSRRTLVPSLIARQELQTEQIIAAERTPWPTLHSLLGADAAPSGVANDFATLRLGNDTPEPTHDAEVSELLARLHR